MSRRLERAVRHALLLVTLASAPAGAVPPILEVLEGAGFTEAEIQQIRDGGVVRGPFESGSERELAIKIAFLVKKPAAEVHQTFQASRDYAYDPSVTAYAQIRGEGSLSDFARLRLEPNTQQMVNAYLNAAPGTTLNLSKQEIAAFNALKQGTGNARERVETQIREALLARHQSYYQKGLAGILPYARSGGKDWNPGKGLRRKTEQDHRLAEYAPAFQRALLDFPDGLPEGVSSRFTWVNFRISDKPTFSLVHRLDLLEGDVYVFSERHYFVSRSHNSVWTVGGAFPVKRGTVVVYINRTSTDQVAGFGSSTKRALGQRVMAGQIAAVFDRLQAGAVQQ